MRFSDPSAVPRRDCPHICCGRQGRPASSSCLPSTPLSQPQIFFNLRKVRHSAFDPHTHITTYASYATCLRASRHPGAAAFLESSFDLTFRRCPPFPHLEGDRHLELRARRAPVLPADLTPALSRASRMPHRVLGQEDPLLASERWASQESRCGLGPGPCGSMRKLFWKGADQPLHRLYHMEALERCQKSKHSAFLHTTCASRVRAPWPRIATVWEERLVRVPFLQALAVSHVSLKAGCLGTSWSFRIWKDSSPARRDSHLTCWFGALEIK